MSSNFVDLTGEKFGRLFVEGRADNDKRGRAMWNCTCSCGGKVTIASYSLRCGSSKSCGCLRRDLLRKRLTTHGMVGTPTYLSWNAMKERCNNPKNINYKNYGDRGITICKRWLTFIPFFEDMGEKPEGLTLERIDNEKGYSPKNCAWRTYTDQNRNKRINSRNKTGIKGVHWNKKSGKYQAYIAANHKRFHLGFFSNLQEARQARIAGEQKYWEAE